MNYKLVISALFYFLLPYVVLKIHDIHIAILLYTIYSWVLAASWAKINLEKEKNPEEEKIVYISTIIFVLGIFLTFHLY